MRNPAGWSSAPQQGGGDIGQLWVIRRRWRWGATLSMPIAVWVCPDEETLWRKAFQRARLSAAGALAPTFEGSFAN